MKSYIGMFFTGLCISILMVGCGGGSESSAPSSDADPVQISGAGIKGPMAFADVKIYKLDPSLPDYYDETSPISIAMTNQYAEINGLSVSRKIKPPYILTIDGSNGIDLNTGVAPVIDTLITVITDDMLAENRPIFATPLTTLVFHMARLSGANTDYKNRRVARKAFIENVDTATSIVGSAFVIGQNHNIDLFRSPLVINEYTTDLVEQEQAVYHRATVEAFAAKVYALAQRAKTGSDTIIEKLALDLYSDNVFNNMDNGSPIGSIDPMVLNQDPMSLLIPNTSYRIEDIMKLMIEERILIGTDMGPEFRTNEIVFPEVVTTTDTTAIISDTISDVLTEAGSTVTNEPVVTLSVDSINFGSQYVGEISNPIALVLTNSGTASLSISDISTTSDFIEANNCSTQVKAGENCTIDVQFAPTRAGDISGKLTIISDATNSTDLINLSGISIDADSNVINDAPQLISPDSTSNAFYNNLNNEPQQTYTLASLQEYWGINYVSDLRGAVEVVADPDPSGTHNNALRVFYAADNYGRRGGSGAQWTKKLSGYDELYVAYDVFFEDDAEFVKGGKLPRLQSTGWDSNAGVPADGTDRWTAGLMWKPDGKLASYVYHANMPGNYGDIRYWDDGVDGQIYFQPGKWHTIEVRAVMNTPGVLDGQMQGWFDGKLAFDTNEFMWRMPGGEHLDIGEFLFSTFYGGSDSSWAPSTDQHIYFDNFVISTQPITH